MTTPFPGFSPEALKFLKALKRNNDREWFQPRKEEYERVLRNPMLDLLGRINVELMKFAPDYVTEPSKAIFRIYRDTRFAKDKTPYKTHVAAVFSHRAMPRNYGAGFYFQVSLEKVGIGGGIYQPPPDLLRKIREHLVEHYGDYQAVIRQVNAKKIAGAFEGQAMTRVPKGWCAEHEAAEMLKCRSLFFYAELPPETALQPGVEKEITSRFKAIAKFVQLIDQPIVGPKKFRLAEPF
jgi:uncharacterized protein (TIGR02453 family)